MKLKNIIFTFLLFILSLSTLDLSAAAYSHQTSQELLRCAIDGNCYAMRALLEKGANPNTQNYFKKALLLFAVEKERTDIVDLLIEYGSDLNIQDYQEISPLHLSIRKGSSTKIMKRLLENGAILILKINMDRLLST